MTLRPFPYPLRVGTDICDISRIVKVITGPPAKAKEHGDELRRLKRFSRRFLTPREFDYFYGTHVNKSGSNIGNDTLAIWSSYLAGRWAAKEAVIKAVKPRRITFSEIEIWPSKEGAPFAILLDQAAGNGPTATDSAESGPLATQNGGATDEQLQKPSLTEGEGPSSIRLVGSGNWSDEEIHNSNIGEAVPSHQGIYGEIAQLSISHDSNYATAVALVASDPNLDSFGLRSLHKEGPTPLESGISETNPASMMSLETKSRSQALNERGKALYGKNFRSGDWICPAVGCEYHNFAKQEECFRCGAARPEDTDRQTFAGWNCPNEACGFQNYARRVKCFKCGARAPLVKHHIS